jgi:hypothetical protein
LLPASNPAPGDWWYYAIEHGQHVSIYTYKSLSIIAERFGLNLYTNGSSFHLLTKKKIHPQLFKIMFRKKVMGALRMILEKRHTKKSLLEEDFYQNSGLRLR